MRFGIITPVLTLLPKAHARWEREGTIDDVVEIAKAADALGYDHLTCSEHVVVPTDVAEQRGGRYWDPVATLGYLAAHTTRIRLAASVVVLGYHHPLAIAKRYATLDQVSKGRVVLGVGVGSLAEEFALLGAPFADRGARADDALRALRVSLSSTTPRYDGEHYRFADVQLDPGAWQAHLPIWVGGRTGRSLRRAVALADGWCPFGLRASEAAGLLAAAARTPAWAERAQPFEVVLQPTRALDPGADAGTTVEAIRALHEAGASMIGVRLVHRSRDHYIEQLQSLRRLTDQEDL